MTGRVLRIALATAVLLIASPGTAGAATPDDLILSTPPPGFSVATSAAAINGPLDVDRLLRLAGVDPSTTDVPHFDAAARTWVNATGQVIVVIAVKADSDTNAGAFARGAAASARKVQGLTTFDSGLPGISGVSGTRDGRDLRAITWAQGPYGITMVHGGQTLATGVIEAVARDEAAMLQTKYGVTVDPDSDNAESTSVATIVGVAILSLAFLVGAVAMLSRRRRRTPAVVGPLGPPPSPPGYTGFAGFTTPPPPLMSTAAAPLAARDQSDWDDRFTTNPASTPER